MVILHSIESILTIIIIIAIGYYLTSIKWFNEETSKSFAKLVTNVALPAYMIANLMGNFSKSKLEYLAAGLWVPFLSITMCILISILFSNLLKIRQGRKGTFESMFFNSNTIFIGLPINLALFGDKSVPYVLLYYIANTTFFWTLGVYFIGKDSKSNIENKAGFNIIKKIISPPLLGFIIAIIFILINLKLPSFIMDTCKYLGQLTTPLSMIFIGISIYFVKLRDMKLDKDILGVLAGRFIISPLTMLLIVYFLPIPTLMKKVFIVQSAMPVMTNAPIIAKTYNADSSYAAITATVSTILSMVTIPIMMVLFQHL